VDVPSMTTCPASVPVIVLFCPLASSASAKMTEAALAPRVGDSSLYASCMSTAVLQATQNCHR